MGGFRSQLQAFYVSSHTEVVIQRNSLLTVDDNIYIYIYIYIIITTMSYCEHRFPWLSLLIRLYHPSHSADPPEYILCLYKAVVDRFLPDIQHLFTHMKESTGECCWWAWPYSSSSALHVFFFWFQWVLRWEVGDRTAAVIWGVTSRNCSLWLIAFFCNIRQAFSPCA